ncbi:hypothetical protein ACQEU3_39430 [Spirillospora sp. CA-253888]
MFVSPWLLDATTAPTGPPSGGGGVYDLFGGIKAAIADQVTAWLADRGVCG